MKMKIYSIFAIFAIICLLTNIKADSVCDLNTLIVEIKQDLKYPSASFKMYSKCKQMWEIWFSTPLKMKYNQ